MWNVVDLCEHLCAIPSVTGDEARVVDEVVHILTACGMEVRRQAVGDVRGRDNVLALWPGVEPQVMLTTHLDTVPPHIPPRREADRVTGRGTCDAKGIAAAMICAVEELHAAREDRVALLFVVGEELGSDGAKAAAKGFAPRVRYFIDGEPTELKLAAAMKGAIVFDLEATGKAGHSAYPETGASAVHQLLDDLHRLVHAPWPLDPEVGATTLNVGTLEGGVAPNVIAPSARARCVLRASTDADALLSTLRSHIHEETRLHVSSSSGPVRLATLAGYESCVVAFGSDVPYLSPLGTPMLVGPGSIHDAHTAHEYVLIEDLQRSVALYRQLVDSLLATPPEGAS